MREIIFRGKHIKNGVWVQGSYYHLTEFYGDNCNYHYIIETCDEREDKMMNYFPVDFETVGQYTGLKDKNGKMIFEGDIVKNEWCFIKGNSIVRFGEYKSLDRSNDYQCGHLGFYLEHISDFNKRTVRKDIMYFANKCEIVGNIHDNPELLRR